MAKKIIAMLLAIATVLCCVAVSAYADEPEIPPVVEEPKYQYELHKDVDFSTIKTIDVGNATVTKIYPGDKLFFEKNHNTDTNSRNKLTIKFYPDVDSYYKPNWTPISTEIVAFSLSGEEMFTQGVSAAEMRDSEQIYTVPGYDATVKDAFGNEKTFDFTIAYPEENTFEYWICYEYGFTSGGRTMTLCGVWSKGYTGETDEEDIEDFEYILNSNTTITQRILAPIMAAWKKLANDLTVLYEEALDKMTGNETVHVEMGVYKAFITRMKITIQILGLWLDSWVTPIMTMFD